MGSDNENERGLGPEAVRQRSAVEGRIPDHRTQIPVFKSYRDLEVWQRAMELVVECYQITKRFPKSETFGLASQLQRAAVSIPANIAEGRGRQHTKEFIQHIAIAYGSLAELETHIQIAERLTYIDKSQIDSLMGKTAAIGRMLNGLRRSLEKKRNEVQNV